MNFSNCKIFRRSFTNKGLGFTANNEIEDILMKKDFKSKALFPNTNRRPTLMKSASLKDSLHVVVENNFEEVEKYEEHHKLKQQPTQISVSLHNPAEPADMRSNSIEIVKLIPLGHSTLVYIYPKGGH